MNSKYISLATVLILANNIGFADETDNNSSKIEIIANQIDATKTTAKAMGDVLVYYGSTILRSDSAFFDKNTTLLTLDGNIDSIGYERSKEQSNHLVLNTKTKNINFDKLFLTDDSDIWLYTNGAKKNEEIYNIGNTIVSSCSIKDPLWKVVFNKSSYEKNKNYMKVYGAKLYMWDVPILYMPYFAFNTKKERRSGLLFPKLGLSTRDGLIYEQPIFLAFDQDWDIELNPQIRTNRTNGLYGTVRFADSEFSRGEFRVGLFHDLNTYTLNQNNRNSNHYGAEFIYDSSKIFSNLPFKMQDGFYTNLIYLNDIDYVNLQKNKIGHFGDGYFQESRLNYLLTNSDYYMGVNAKYFIDTTALSNSGTMQLLPSFTFHKYYAPMLNSIPLNYSFDMQIANYTRRTGATLGHLEVFTPIEYSTNLFDNYMKLTLSEEIYGKKIIFNNTLNNEESFSYLAPLQTIKLYSDLTKKYNNGVHIIQPYSKYVYPSEIRSGTKTYDSLGNDVKELFKIDLANARIEIGGSQYFYGTNDLKIYQKLLQPYYTKLDYKYGDLQHEFGISNKNFNLSNTILYSHYYHKIRSSYSSFSFVDSAYNASLTHSYNTSFPSDIIVTPHANDIGFNLSYNSSNFMRWYSGINYNISDRYSTSWRIGGDYESECFGLNIYLKKQTTPSLETTGVSYNSDTGVYFQVNFKPFASTGS